MEDSILDTFYQSSWKGYHWLSNNLSTLCTKFFWTNSLISLLRGSELERYIISDWVKRVSQNESWSIYEYRTSMGAKMLLGWLGWESLSSGRLTTWNIHRRSLFILRASRVAMRRVCEICLSSLLSYLAINWEVIRHTGPKACGRMSEQFL